MSFEHGWRHGVPFAFIPHQLEIANHPELNVFPFNVMFAKYKVENGKTIMGTSLYEPDLGSFRQESSKYFMEYHNIYGANSWLEIEYDIAQKSYLGKKLVNKETVGMATGGDWKMFFIHFTALGLANGEHCEFKDVTKPTEVI